MPSGFIRLHETFPEPHETFPLVIPATHGVEEMFVGADGSGEIDIIDRHSGEKRNEILVIPVKFPTIDQAERAAAALATAFDTVRGILAETPASPDDGHEHETVWKFRGRDTVKHEFCRLCGAHLGEMPLEEWRTKYVAA